MIINIVIDRDRLIFTYRLYEGDSCCRIKLSFLILSQDRVVYRVCTENALIWQVVLEESTQHRDLIRLKLFKNNETYPLMKVSETN